MSPEHYSSQLPTRCLELLNDCWLDVSNRPKEQHGGALTTTLLLTLSMPMLLMPLERVEFFSSGDERYGSEFSSRPKWTESFLNVFRKPRLKDATEFFQARSWSYAACSTDLRLNNLPSEWLSEFDKSEAYERAEQLGVQQWARILRNSLAHGSVAYLDNRGKHTHGARADKLLFVSEKRKRDKRCSLCGHQESFVIGLQCLRISVPSYRTFLASWVSWLQSCGAEKGLATDKSAA